MKKNKVYYGRWKNWKRRSFTFYLVLFVTIATAVAVLASIAFFSLFERVLSKQGYLLPAVIVVLIGLAMGLCFSVFIGKVLLKPIAKLQSAMDSVTEGDFTVSVTEKNRFDEIENINHSFNIMTKELRATETLQNDFITNVSHEFKTPLATIDGYATLLQDSSLTEEEREDYIKQILSTTSSMTELVTNVLLISKLDNQAVASKKEEYFIDEQIRKIVVDLEPQWSKKNLEFDVNLQPVKYTANKGVIRHVWLNLIGNAIKFSEDCGRITISLVEEEKNVVFKIADQGEGVKDEIKQKIFDKFFQGDTSHKQEGNGLGLALVKRIVDNYNGTVSVENLTDKGCQFTVTLPITNNAN